MTNSTKTWLWIGGAAALVWYLSRKSGSLKGLGDAPPTDVSRQSDLLNLCENYCGMEAHLTDSAATTGDPKYVAALDKVRQMRREAMSKLLPPDASGNSWCLTKHAIAGAMHAREVGDKCMAEGNPEDAQAFYKQSQELKNSALAIAATATPGGQCPVCQADSQGV